MKKTATLTIETKKGEIYEPKINSSKMPKIDDKQIFSDNQKDDELDSLFSSELGQKPESIIQLFDGNYPETKSDLSEREISLIAILKYQARVTGLDDLSEAIDNLVLYRISKDRKSRSEFVQGLQAKNEQQGNGFFTGIKNALTGNQGGLVK